MAVSKTLDQITRHDTFPVGGKARSIRLQASTKRGSISRLRTCLMPFVPVGIHQAHHFKKLWIHEKILEAIQKCGGICPSTEHAVCLMKDFKQQNGVSAKIEEIAVRA